jgi:hypothetical protein
MKASADPLPDDQLPEAPGPVEQLASGGRPHSHASSPGTPRETSRSRRAEPNAPTPQLYIATPLTGLDAGREEALSHRLETVKGAILEATVGARTTDDQWPVRLHVPYDTTRPGSGDGLNPQTIYDINLDTLLESDGLVVVADKFCSAGVGQEIEWASRSGIPVLYLSPETASRQILGNPHGIYSRTCLDAQDMAGHVRSWLSANREKLQHGPRRRDDRNLAYVGIQTRLAVAWTQATNPTEVAAQLNLHPADVDSMLKAPARLALTPWWTVCELATLLSVPLEARRTLSFTESRAWVTAAADGAWDQTTADHVRTYALIIGAQDLELVATWTELHDSFSGH